MQNFTFPLRLVLFVFTAVSVPAAMFLGCVSTSDQNSFDVAPLFGMVYDLGNDPIPSVSVRLDGTSPVVTSDHSGRFVLPRLRRGVHVVELTKKGFEPSTQTIDFQDQSQVLYVRMISAEQLLVRAADAVELQQWACARRALERATRVEPANSAAAFLFAILELRTVSPTAAKERLLTLLESGAEARAIYLLLADIYQNQLHEPKLAREALEGAQRISSDPVVAERLRSLATAPAASPK